MTNIDVVVQEARRLDSGWKINKKTRRIVGSITLGYKPTLKDLERWNIPIDRLLSELGCSIGSPRRLVRLLTIREAP